jgi:hypothetical protein
LSYPVLYPLLGPVGLTVFFFPGPNGKDLDNIFPLVVPTLLEQLHPLARRRTRMHSLTINSSSGTPCGADKPYPTNPTSRFIEVKRAAHADSPGLGITPSLTPSR